MIPNAKVQFKTQVFDQSPTALRLSKPQGFRLSLMETIPAAKTQANPETEDRRFQTLRKPTLKKIEKSAIGLSTVGQTPMIVKRENIIKKKSPLGKHLIANLFDDDVSP